jgi:hypothetical protein
MIAFAIIIIPKMTNELIEKMNLQSVYARQSYRPKSRFSKHIVIGKSVHLFLRINPFE